MPQSRLVFQRAVAVASGAAAQRTRTVAVRVRARAAFIYGVSVAFSKRPPAGTTMSLRDGSRHRQVQARTQAVRYIHVVVPFFPTCPAASPPGARCTPFLLGTFGDGVHTRLVPAYPPTHSAAAMHPAPSPPRWYHIIISAERFPQLGAQNETARFDTSN